MLEHCHCIFLAMQASVLALLSALGRTMASLEKDDVKAHTPLLTEIFMSTLDYRSTRQKVKRWQLVVITLLSLKLYISRVIAMLLCRYPWQMYWRWRCAALRGLPILW